MATLADAHAQKKTASAEKCIIIAAKTPDIVAVV